MLKWIKEQIKLSLVYNLFFSSDVYLYRSQKAAHLIGLVRESHCAAQYLRSCLHAGLYIGKVKVFGNLEVICDPNHSRMHNVGCRRE